MPDYPFGKRKKLRLALQGIEHGLQEANARYNAQNYPEAFDIYEQLAEENPQQAIAILADAFDHYQAIWKTGRYNMYQGRHFDFGVKPGDKVMDIGSGHYPYPFATHLADLAVTNDQVGRAGTPFKKLDGKPVYECDVENMPFADKEFDFIYCSHVLEHAKDPQKACNELMRVAKRGYIETPTRAKDILMNSAKVSNHFWCVEAFQNVLTFTEYTPDEIEGVGCGILMDMHCNPQTPREKAFSALIFLKADMFNTMFLWDGWFRCEVRRLSPQPAGQISYFIPR